MSINYEILWQSLEDLNEVGTLLDARTNSSRVIAQATGKDDGDERAWQELSGVLETVAKAKELVVPLLNHTTNNTAFDVCVQSVKNGASALLKAVRACTSPSPTATLEDDDGVELASDMTLLEKAVVVALRADYVLTVRLEQMVSLFTVVGDGEEGSDVVLVPHVVVCPRGTDTKEPETLKKATRRPSFGAEPRDFLTDKQGCAFWVTSFGEKTLLVPWKAFARTYISYLNVDVADTETERILRRFIDVTQDGFVSPYDFALFLQWFGPLIKSAIHLLSCVQQRLLGGFVSAYEAEFALRDKPAGSFFLRLSKSKRDTFAVALVTEVYKTKRVVHSKLAAGSMLGGVSVKQGNGRKLTYRSVSGFCRAYQDKLALPAGPIQLTPTSVPPTLLEAQESEAEEQEHVEEACTSIFSTATEPQKKKRLPELCVVCMDVPASTVFLECGHICCCADCGKKLTVCPICRMYITRMVNVFLP